MIWYLQTNKCDYPRHRLVDRRLDPALKVQRLKRRLRPLRSVLVPAAVCLKFQAEISMALGTVGSDGGSWPRSRA
jgi:hypothetical protein